MSAVTEKPCPAAISAIVIPTRQTGIANSMTKRQAERLELNGHHHEDDHHRECDRDAEPGEGRFHELHLADVAAT